MEETSNIRKYQLYSRLGKKLVGVREGKGYDRYALSDKTGGQEDFSEGRAI